MLRILQFGACSSVERLHAQTFRQNDANELALQMRQSVSRWDASHLIMPRQARRGFLNAALVLASIALAPIVYAAEVGDTQRGHAYAKKVCAKCHAVEGGDMISPTMILPLRTRRA